MSSVEEQIRGLDHSRLRNVMRLTGLADADLAIRVLLLSEKSPIARETSPWIAGFAEARLNVVVLFPARIGSYPYDSIEKVLHHEIAHILIDRATHGARVPRWFNEGLASAAERDRGLAERTRLGVELLVGRQLTATELEGLFSGEPEEVARAYVLADALVRDLLAHYGRASAARILARMAEGQPFEQALYTVTGVSVREVITNFWKRHQIWESWISFLGHPFTIWIFITALALAAIWRHRRRRAERRVRWELEEQAEEQEWENHRRQYRLH